MDAGDELTRLQVIYPGYGIIMRNGQEQLLMASTCPALSIKAVVTARRLGVMDHLDDKDGKNVSHMLRYNCY